VPQFEVRVYQPLRGKSTLRFLAATRNALPIKPVASVKITFINLSGEKILQAVLSIALVCLKKLYFQAMIDAFL